MSRSGTPGWYSRSVYQVGGARSPPASRGRFGPREATTVPLSREATSTVRTPRRPNQHCVALYAKPWPKSRLVTDFPDTPGGCLSCLLGVRPRAGTAGVAAGRSSGGSGPRWGGAETKHGVQVEEPSGRSSAGDALAPRLALESSWKALGRVFHRHRGVSHSRSRPRWTKH